MINVSVARRYARALLDAAGASSDAVLEQLNAFSQLLQSSRELSDVVTNPAFPRAEKVQAIEAVLTASGITEPTLGNLLRLLVDRNRLEFLPDIARIYRDLADMKAGRVRGQVTSAAALAPESVRKIEQSLELLTQRRVVLESKVDPKLLGGVSTQLGSTVYDGSVKTQLEQLRRTLTLG
jgi:F-type H+-transporting ATPase subunit delta